MFARLRNLFGRAREDGRETRERRKETALSSESNAVRRRWSWGRQSKFGEVDVQGLPELAFLTMGQGTRASGKQKNFHNYHNS